MLLQSTNLKAQEPLCEKVIIQYVNFYILTFVAVKCSDFEERFSDKDITISNQKEIEELIGLLNK